MREMFFTIKETARLLGYSNPHIYWMIRTGKLKATKWNRDWMISADSVRKYKRKHGIQK